MMINKKHAQLERRGLHGGKRPLAFTSACLLAVALLFAGCFGGQEPPPADRMEADTAARDTILSPVAGDTEAGDTVLVELEAESLDVDTVSSELEDEEPRREFRDHRTMEARERARIEEIEQSRRMEEAKRRLEEAEWERRRMEEEAP